jgi:hypothetical protein
MGVDGEHGLGKLVGGNGCYYNLLHVLDTCFRFLLCLAGVISCRKQGVFARGWFGVSCGYGFRWYLGLENENGNTLGASHPSKVQNIASQGDDNDPDSTLCFLIYAAQSVVVVLPPPLSPPKEAPSIQPI